MSCTFWAKFDSDFFSSSNDVFVFKMGTALMTDNSEVGSRAQAVIIKNPDSSPYFYIN